MSPRPTTGSLDKDVTFPADATDTISSIRWSPVTSHLAAASWDGNVRIYDVSSDIRCMASISTGQPLMSCDFSKDGKTVVAAGADKRVHVLGAGAGPGQSLAFPAHEQPIRAVCFLDGDAPVVATGGWDSTLRYWDLRNASQPLCALALGERVYSMDTAKSLLVAATADRKAHVIDLTRPDAILRTEESPHTYQTKVVAVCPTGERWTTASIEGRIGLMQVDEKKKKDKNFSWKCHRAADPNDKKVTRVFAINDACFNPQSHDVVATAGSDGSIVFWNVSGRNRLQTFTTPNEPVTACAFNHDGKLFAYATGYDWARGYDGNKVNCTTLKMHTVTQAEMSKRRP